MYIFDLAPSAKPSQKPKNGSVVGKLSFVGKLAVSQAR